MYIHQAKLNQIRNAKEAGFTLVETLVALVILTMALIPILAVSSSATRLSEVIKDDLVASGLTQEGIEVVRAIRDTNWFNGRPFDSGLGSGVMGESTVYRVQWNSSDMISLGSNPPLQINNGIYSYDPGGTNTKFTRTVTITKVNAGELKVTSQVTWVTQTNNAKTINAESHLFNWR